MNVYTSEGLLVEQGAGANHQTLAAEQGQQLISIYRLFLQLHHAGNGAMRIKDMLKPDAADTVGDNGAEKATDRRANAGRQATTAATMNSRWSSMPSMPEAASAYTSSAAAVSTGMPYPMFLLSSNAIPETHRLRGFASQRSPHRPSSPAGTKNNNRSANGSEEIPLRWSLLSKQPPSAYALSSAGATASAALAAGSGGGAPVTHDTAEVNTPRGQLDGSGESANGATASMQDDEGETAQADEATLGGAKSLAESGGRLSTTAAAAAGGAATAASSSVPLPRTLASGWVAAELQVHTTHRVLVCTATELALGVEEVADDGDAPLVFCCCVQSGSS